MAWFPDKTRRYALWDDPARITPDEVKLLVEVANDFERLVRTITIRDQFAMAALTGLMAREVMEHKERAQVVYRVADAMLTARSER